MLGDWRSKAECRHADPDLFFPQGKGYGSVQQTAAAKEVCLTRCRVREQCLDYALTQEEIAGIWGGLSEIELRAQRTRRRLATG